MDEVPGYGIALRCLPIMALLLVGCANRQTYDESKYHFTEPRGVVQDQADWVMPDVLEIYSVQTRREICKVCNNPAAGRKGSHFTIFGWHKPDIQDRGCYITNKNSSVGRVYYLAGDRVAKSHEIAHHYHGPRHEQPRPWRRWPSSMASVGRYGVAATGSRIARSYRGR